MKAFLPHVESSTILLAARDLPPGDRIIVARVALGSGAVDDVTSEVKRSAEAEYAAAPGPELPRPFFLSPDEKAGYDAAVWHTVRSMKAGQPPPPVAGTLPALATRATRLSREGGNAIGQNTKRVASAKEELTDHERREELARAKYESAGALEQQSFVLRVIEVVATLIEIGLNVLVVKSYLGGFSGAAGTNRLLQVFGIAIMMSAGSYLAGRLIAHFFPEIAKRRWLVTVLGVLGLLGIVSLLFAVVGLRYAATDGYGAESALIGSWSLTVLAGASAAAYLLMIAWIHSRRRELEPALREAIKREDAAAAKGQRLGKEHTKAGEELARAQQNAVALESLGTTFETATRLAAEHERKVATAIDHRVSRAKSVLELLLQLDRPSREAVVSELWELVPATGVPGVTPKALLLLIALLGTLPVLHGCTAPTPAVTVTVCDTTGASPESVCTHGMLKRAYFALSTDHPAAESHFIVLRPNNSYATTRVLADLSLPDGDGAAAEAFIVKSLATLDRVDLSVHPKRNESDLIDALFDAEERTAPFRARHIQRTLLFASDGLTISPMYGINADRGPVPTGSAVVSALRRLGLTLDLSAFRVEVCGFGNAGLTAAKAAARDRLWEELIEAFGGPMINPAPTCADLYPPLPKNVAAAVTRFEGRQ